MSDSPTPQPTTADVRWKPQIFLAVVVAAPFVLFLFFPYALNEKFPKEVTLAVVSMALFGACGGLLYAMREGDIELAQLGRKRSSGENPTDVRILRLGWAADVLSGAAGGIVAVSLLPTLSNDLGNVYFDLLNPPTKAKPEAPPPREAAAPEVKPPEVKPGTSPPHGPDADDKARADRVRNHTGTYISFIAVALIGGYGGRALLKNASESMLRRKIDLVWDELLATKVDSKALALVARQLTPGLPSPSLQELETSLAAASPNAHTRILAAALTQIQSSDAHVAKYAAKAALPVIDILHRLAPEDHQTLDAMKAALAQFSAGEAASALKGMIERLKAAGPGNAPFVKEYTELVATYDPPASSLTTMVPPSSPPRGESPATSPE